MTPIRPHATPSDAARRSSATMPLASSATWEYSRTAGARVARWCAPSVETLAGGRDRASGLADRVGYLRRLGCSVLRLHRVLSPGMPTA